MTRTYPQLSWAEAEQLARHRPGELERAAERGQLDDLRAELWGGGIPLEAPWPGTAGEGARGSELLELTTLGESP